MAPARGAAPVVETGRGPVESAWREPILSRRRPAAVRTGARTPALPLPWVWCSGAQGAHGEERGYPHGAG